MDINIVLPSNIVYVAGYVNHAAVVFQQEADEKTWSAKAEQNAENTYLLELDIVDEAGNRTNYIDTIEYVLPYFIYDRTIQDVEQRTAKGYINASDLNRVERNTGIIAEYIGIEVSVNENWEIGELPRVSDYKRIRENVQSIRDNYMIYTSTPEVPEQPLNDYKKWNAIERILHDVYVIYFGNISNVDYCGEIAAGEEIGVI